MFQHQVLECLVKIRNTFTSLRFCIATVGHFCFQMCIFYFKLFWCDPLDEKMKISCSQEWCKDQQEIARQGKTFHFPVSTLGLKPNHSRFTTPCRAKMGQKLFSICLRSQFKIRTFAVIFACVDSFHRLSV